MIEEGDIWDYPYLWRWQDGRGETEGRKTRPCALAVKVAVTPQQTRLYFLAITSKKPDSKTTALQIPDTERHRARLSTDLDLWVILEECNVDILEDSFYFEQSGKIGQFSSTFLKNIKSELRAIIQKKKFLTVKRTD
ncbi:hypothetical protein [Paremcibacter congregatus]|uniref:Type II toxin-antitoxin system PemK/MazF family toxin n=1 Tax=Paremcibacter congregatus TaxID=2043170 RepID=A0A2G4YVJ3_9PROT|nr:hypothetical protein [Paremcibacter congregatus]PHZ86374.1 hypothetical protein CRD36_02095 [Paremcibacter congregatus]QDE27981.1 hypothetical protein FIV45_12215 [Paremcibacter congregatus]